MSEQVDRILARCAKYGITEGDKYKTALDAMEGVMDAVEKERDELRAALSESVSTEKLFKALDDLHVACECETIPEVAEWYRCDPFASEARQNALNAILSYHSKKQNK